MEDGGSGAAEIPQAAGLKQPAVRYWIAAGFSCLFKDALAEPSVFPSPPPPHTNFILTPAS